jgi:hypothetical protein
VSEVSQRRFGGVAGAAVLDIRLISPAPKMGRGGWQALAVALRGPGAPKRAEWANLSEDFIDTDSNWHFEIMLRAAEAKDNSKTGKAARTVFVRVKLRRSRYVGTVCRILAAPGPF